MRPGEKLFEELLTAEEGTDASAHQQIFVARQGGVDEAALRIHLDLLLDAARRHDGLAIRQVMAQIVPSAQFAALGHAAPAPPAVSGDSGGGQRLPQRP